MGPFDECGTGADAFVGVAGTEEVAGGGVGEAADGVAEGEVLDFADGEGAFEADEPGGLTPDFAATV